MTYTPRLQAFGGAVSKLQRELTKAEDDLLELRDREKRLGAMETESDQELAAQYGMGEI
ncbi:hypothetical protein [Blastococcus sp. TF02-8]|uniref:hypothetical protein n=1 Tax=Blastococcus sp. TF02-8 TaxID=2250574 RepID=UPI0014123A0E|nr:hypothetical protein [Blastococcus sp. TF02-8]